jgi:chromate transporter
MTPAQIAGPAPSDYSHARLFLRFLRFGLSAFGGPVAQIAMIRKALVEDERWISGPEFNRLLAVMQVLPGPEAHELCVHLGIRAKGRLGGLLAGLGFMLPGLILMLAAAWAYQRFMTASDGLAAAFLGVQIGVLAIIARAVRHIGGHVLEDALLWGLGVGALVATLAGVSFWVILATAGAVYTLGGPGRWANATLALVVGLAAAVGLHLLQIEGGWAPQPPMDGSPADAMALFWSGLKAGLLTFGGAYTAIPFVRADTVGRGWIGDGPFLDGVAFAGVMPAPLVIFCTFVGYVAGGWPGALAITAGVFLPAFAFSMILYERLERIVEDVRLHRALAGVAAGVVGLIAATLLQLGWSTAQRLPSLWPALAIFAVSLAAILFWRSRYAAPAVIAASALLGHALFAG